MQTIEFGRCSRRACAPRRITFVNDRNDVEVEEVESFHLFLTSNFPLVTPDPYTAEVIIHDDSESELALIPHLGYTCLCKKIISIMHIVLIIVVLVHYFATAYLSHFASFSRIVLVLSHYETNFLCRGLCPTGAKGIYCDRRSG